MLRKDDPFSEARTASGGLQREGRQAAPLPALFLPIYFANLIFSAIFKEQKFAEHIFGWNLLGATFGGVLEYSSMALGYNALSLIVLGCYTLVFLLLLAAKRRMSPVRERKTGLTAPLEIGGY